MNIDQTVSRTIRVVCSDDTRDTIRDTTPYETYAATWDATWMPTRNAIHNISSAPADTVIDILERIL